MRIWKLFIWRKKLQQKIFWKQMIILQIHVRDNRNYVDFCHHQNYIINDGKPNWDLCKGTQLGLVSSKIVFAIWKVGGRGPSKGNYILPKGSFVWAFPHPKLPSNSPLGLAPGSINIWLFGLADWVPWT